MKLLTWAAGQNKRTSEPVVGPMEWAMMVSKLSFELRAVICKAASHLTGFQRRLFVAQVAIEYSQASPPQAESMFGFNRRAVARGLQELELGKPIRIRPAHLTHLD